MAATGAVIILYWIYRNGRIERADDTTDEERAALAQRRDAPAPHSIDDIEDFLDREVWDDDTD